MYTDLAKGSSLQEQKKETISKSILNDFKELNERQENRLHSIQDKLHDLLNKRKDQDKSEPPVNPEMYDFNSAMTNELHKMSMNSNILDNIYNHLLEIV